MKKIILAILCFLASPAFAQQQLSPPEVALQMNSVVGQWAQTIVQQTKTIGGLQKEIAAKDARIKELEAKTEPKKE